MSTLLAGGICENQGRSAKSKDEIIEAVFNWMNFDLKNASKNQIYVGITENINRRLHGDHRLTLLGAEYIDISAISEKDARDAENELINLHGFWGGTGGGDHPTIVYAYRITLHTKESDDEERQRKIKKIALR